MVRQEKIQNSEKRICSKVLIEYYKKTGTET